MANIADLNSGAECTGAAGCVGQIRILVPELEFRHLLG